MPFTVKPYEHRDNVILVTYMGVTTPEEVRESVEEVCRLAEDMPRPVYQLGDFRTSEGNFGNVLKIATRTFSFIKKRYTERDITGPLVVNDITNPWLRLSRDLAERFGIGALMVFETIEGALTYIDTLQTEKTEQTEQTEKAD